MVAALVSSFVTTKAIQTLNHGSSLASPRRILGLLFASTILWIIPSSLGAVAAAVGHAQAASYEFLLGGFLSWTFELVVINGVFLTSTSRSLIASASHPAIVMLSVLVIAHSSESPYTLIFGPLILLSGVVFLLLLKRLKTRNNISSLRLLHAFLATWVVREPGELEACFSQYAEEKPIKTQVMLAKTQTRSLCLVVPGVHPGPFSPVGSYNISELIYRALHSDNVLPIVLHGTGGHERNTPTNELASQYANTVQGFIASLQVRQGLKIRGPLLSKLGVTNVTVLAIGNEIAAFLSTAPFISDDIDPATIADATEIASELGHEITIVDAHNSIGGENHAQEPLTKADWRKLIDDLFALPENEFKLGFANSSEIGFKHGADISDGGISVTIFATDETQSVLVTADSNNAVSGLREKIADAVEKLGFRFIELCTSDTHVFAARSLTDRGYFSLGEATKIEEIIGAVQTLTLTASRTAAECDIIIEKLITQTPLIGQESLDDFATLTAKATSLGKSYYKVIIPMAILFTLITLFY